MGYTKSVSEQNKDDYIYLRGDAITEGSIRMEIDLLKDAMEVTTLKDGVWGRYSLELSTGTLWLGKEVGLGAMGHNLITEQSGNNVHFFPHTIFNTATKTHGHDAAVTHIYGNTVRFVAQADESGEFTGVRFTTSLQGVGDVLVSNSYYKTGNTSPTTVMRNNIYQGTDETGTLIFSQNYSASNFPANTEINLPYNGSIEYHDGVDYFGVWECDTSFSFKTNAAVDEFWIAADLLFKREDNLFQTVDWINGNTYIEDQWLIQNRKIYVCKVTGVQTGTFASNSDKWDPLITASSVDVDIAIFDRVLTSNEGEVVPDNNGNLTLSN